MIKHLVYYLKALKYYMFFAVMLLLTTCNNSQFKPNNSLVFKYNEHKNINSLDPAFSKDIADIWATNQLFNGLVQLNDSLGIEPCIAKRWEISENGLRYQFVLRKDVFFHKHKAFGKDSTRLVTAYDFEYSFNRIIDETIASPGSWVFQKVADFKAVNDSVFEMQLKQPFPAFLGLLSMKYCSVVPHEIVALYGAQFRAHPIGTGPFVFKRWEENIKLVFRKNKNYFETDKNGVPLPYLEAVAITFLPDKQAEFLQFAQGNIDFVSGLDASYKDDILTPNGTLNTKYAQTVTMLRAPYLNTEYLAFNLEFNTPEIQSEKLRKAINYGFDRSKMILYLRNGIGIPAYGGFIPKGLPGYNDTIGYGYKPDKAKQLVLEFIKETGIKQPKISIATTSNYLSFSEYIQRELEKIGLQVIINVMPAASLKEAKANNKLDIFRASWVADYPDAENYLGLFYSPNFAPKGPNYTHFKNPEFDTLFQQSYLETNAHNRAVLYQNMDAIVMQHAPVVVLFYDEVVRFTQNNVKQLGINPINLLNLKYVHKK